MVLFPDPVGPVSKTSPRSKSARDFKTGGMPKSSKSFTTSGSEIFFKKDINNKEIKFFYKNSDLPILEELIEIIKESNFLLTITDPEKQTSITKFIK